MTLVKRLFMACLALIACNQASAITISASKWSKTLENGTKQNIYLFGDFHIFLNQQPQQLHDCFKVLKNSDQELFIKYAKKLNAVVLVEDYSDFDPSFKIFTPLQRLLHRYFDQGKNLCTPIFGLKKCCENNEVACINIETRHNSFITEQLHENHTKINSILAYLYTLGYATHYLYENNPFYNHLINNWKKYFLLSLASLLLTANSFYAAYHDHSSCIQRANSHENLKNHFELLKTGYKKMFNILRTPTVHLTGWQVDVNALNEILNRPTTENIFICAGNLHTTDIAYFLQQNGYTQEAKIEDKIAIATGYTHLDIENPLDLETFMQQATGQSEVAY